MPDMNWSWDAPTQTTTPSYKLKKRNSRFLSSKWIGYFLMSASPIISRYRSLISSKQTRLWRLLSARGLCTSTPCSLQQPDMCGPWTSSALEKPRFVILGFQTNRQNKKDQNASHFDHAKLRDVKLYLNSQCCPYANLNLDITNNQFALLYDMYSHFQSEYYSKEEEKRYNDMKREDGYADGWKGIYQEVWNSSRQNSPLNLSLLLRLQCANPSQNG